MKFNQSLAKDSFIDQAFASVVLRPQIGEWIQLKLMERRSDSF
jgi:hypothetical protein